MLSISFFFLPYCLGFDFIYFPVVLKSSTNCQKIIQLCLFVALLVLNPEFNACWRSMLLPLLCVPSNTRVLVMCILCLTFVSLSPGVYNCFLPFFSARRTQANVISVSCSVFWSSWFVFLTYIFIYSSQNLLNSFCNYYHVNICTIYF